MTFAKRLRVLVCALGLVVSAGVAESRAQVLLNPRIGHTAAGAVHHRNRGMSNAYRGGMGTSMAGYATRMNRGNQGQGIQYVARELMMTRALLQRGDHDYGGHRSRAVHDIGLALRALGHGGNGTNSMGGMNGMNGMSGANGVRPGGNRAGTGANGAHREPQAMSDGQLRQAIQNLNTINNQLSSANNARVAQARVPVQRAITELNTALTIR